MRSLILLTLLSSVAAADVTTFDGQTTPTFRGQAGARYDGFDVLTSASILANSPDLGGSFLGSTLTQTDPSAIITSTQNIYNFSGPSTFELDLNNTAALLELSVQIQLSGTGIDPASVTLAFVDGTGAAVQIAPTASANLNDTDPGEIQFMWDGPALAGLEATDAMVSFTAFGAHMSMDVLLVDALLDVPSLVADVPSISLANGGTQTLALEVGTDYAGYIHWVVGSASGAAPGLDLGGVILPLNYDSFTTFTLTNPNTAYLQNTLGPVDAFGQATSAVMIPGGAALSLTGLTLDFAAVVLDPITMAVKFATNSSSLDLLP